uniref:Ig-like domain-containing protein n=1 Tax=Catharus ustulatus TaxID=91951 RepID=A0A8C3UJQ4_CATUS
MGPHPWHPSALDTHPWLSAQPQPPNSPPWTPAVLWDRVTLTCQGSGTAGDTTWDPTSFYVTRSGTYQCERPGTGLSPPVTVSDAWLVLQVPARALLEGDTVTLRCRGWQNKPVTSVSFYRDGKELGTLQDGTELSLSPLQLNHSGRYHCRGLGDILEYRWVQSALVTVTVQGEHPTAATPTPPQPLPRHSGSQIPLPHLLPRALPGAGAGGSPRAPRGVPPQSQLPQHPQPHGTPLGTSVSPRNLSRVPPVSPHPSMG